jgi:hypothetical protein
MASTDDDSGVSMDEVTFNSKDIAALQQKGREFLFDTNTTL